MKRIILGLTVACVAIAVMMSDTIDRSPITEGGWRTVGRLVLWPVGWLIGTIIVEAVGEGLHAGFRRLPGIRHVHDWVVSTTAHQSFSLLRIAYLLSEVAVVAAAIYVGWLITTLFR